MHIKRFEAKDMPEALRLVREELGPDALVLSTRSLKKGRGAFGRFSRSIIEVTAAVDRDVRPTQSGVEPVKRPNEGRARPDPSWNELRLTQALIHPLETEIQQLRNTLDRLALDRDVSTTRELRDEVAALRRVALDLGASAQARPSADTPREAELRKCGLARRHRVALAASDPAQQVELLARMLDDALAPPRPENDGITIYAGPAGVGKTTTLAKVACRNEDAARSLAVVSTDVHRLAAEAPLAAWAADKGIPFETAASPDTVLSAISRAGRRGVLVDTAGRSRIDSGGIQELLAMRDVLGPRARVCLVLPANRSEADLREDIERFRPVAPDALALTHLDESAQLGNVANLLLDGACPPLHWVANGQRVPTDLAIADPHELAQCILGDAA